jgi:UDP-N-acetylglucosamine 1-carboxyvinyltransferase
MPQAPETTSRVFVVEGGRRIDGIVEVQGFKHSLVTVVAAACAARAPLIVANYPRLAETDTLGELLALAGASVSLSERTLEVDASGLRHGELDMRVAERIHGSVYLIPGLLGRFGRVRLPLSGGCQIGDAPGGRRPFEHYLTVLEKFGAEVVEDHAGVSVVAERLTGSDIDLLDYTRDHRLRTGPLYSGASKMALLAAAVAHGPSRLCNLYPKPDVSDLVQVLGEFGADIQPQGEGDVLIEGRGPEALTRPVRHTLLADLIEIVTWVCAGALLASRELVIRGPRIAAACAALQPELSALERMGVSVRLAHDELTVSPAENLIPCDLLVTSPGIYSDSQPFFALLATTASGRSTITETVWGNRFGYADGLRSLGARIARDGPRITIDGPDPPRLADRTVLAGDVRGAAALLLAALMVDGRTRIDGVEHLARGYQDLGGVLRSLGAEISAG